MVKRNIIYMYKKHTSLMDYFCFYCGDYGESKDHIPAISYAEFFSDNERLLVRSCIICNSLLSNRPFHTLLSRLEYLLFAYSKKYKKLLSSPLWTLDEIEELDGSLKSKVKIYMKNRKYIDNKLKFIQSNIDQFMGDINS